MSSSVLSTGLRQLRHQLAAPERREDSDEQLLHAFTSCRDDNAFAVLVQRHGPMVFQVCRRLLGQEQDTEDAFQATFLVLARSAASLRNKGSLASFLHGIAHRLARDAKRSAARRRKYEGRSSSRSPVDPADELSWREVQTLLDEEIASLPEIYRSVFVLCCLENVSRPEVAQRLGLKECTLLSRLAKARKRLSERLTRRGVKLTAVLAASALATPTASALPAGLMAKTMKGVVVTGSGKELAGVVSDSVIELVQGATAAIASKTKTIMAMTLTVALLGGAGMCFLASPQRQQGQPLLALRAGEQIAQVPRSAKRETAEAIEIHGRVLDPDGKPVSGAKLFELRGTSGASPTSPDTRPNVVGTTDAEGRFRIMIRRPDSAVQTYLVGHAAGFGVDWIDLSESRRQAEVMLRLPKDVPITGRIVNTEGRPVAGASVSIADIYTPANEKLDDYLKSGAVNFFQKLFYRETPKQLRVPLDGITGKTATDKDGRFRIRGAGRERIARVSISGGGGVVRSRLWVITRPGFDPKPYNAEQQKGAGAAGMASEYFLYPPALEFIAEAGNAIEGTVKDAASGEPIPGCRMSVWQWGQRGDTVVADVVSGARGEYRLDGLSKNDTVLVRPPKGSVYLSRRVEVANTARQTKVKLDIELSKGVIVVGRVVDKQTGKGVQGNIGFSPLAGNRFYGTKPGFDQRGYDYEETDKDGRFRRVTIPGKSLVKFWVDHQTERLNSQDLSVYRRAAPDPDHKDLFQPVDPERSPNRWYVRTADGNVEQIFGMYSAVKVIDVKEDDETRVELSVDRGVTARIAVQDAGGKPLAGAWASGLTDHPPWLTTFKLPDATATVYALNPDKPREMAFFHVERKLGGTATVRGDENEPVVVKLAPLGQVFGRVFDADGNPLTGVEVSIRAETESGSELYHVAAPPSGKPVRADKDGRFHIEGVVPGLKFTLLLQAKAPIFGGFKGAAVRQVQVKSGEKLDLGDVRVKLGS